MGSIVPLDRGGETRRGVSAPPHRAPAEPLASGAPLKPPAKGSEVRVPCVEPWQSRAGRTEPEPNLLPLPQRYPKPQPRLAAVLIHLQKRIKEGEKGWELTTNLLPGEVLT